MAKNTLTLIITADGKKALDTINATDTSLRKLSSQTYELEKRIKAGNEVSASMADAFRLMNDLVNRNVLAQKQLNPSINENEAALKAWGEMIKTVSTQGGALGSETLEYLKMQYASVAEQIQKATEQITNESKPIENTAKSVEEVSKATDSLAVNTKKASSYWSKLFDTTKNILMFRVIMNVINSIADLSDFLGDSIQVAAEAEQVFSKLNTVFGETSGAMSRAISLATKLGTATSTAASALSTVGDLLQAQGQTTTQSLETASEWVSQFQDIIAFKDINMSLEEFAQNFMSGAAGNLRNFRTFGSIVRESAVNAELAKKGLDKLTGSELELAKMTIRAEMALEQQKNALGATQREWDTMLSVQRRYEESLKSLKENMGNYLEPMTKWWITLKTAIIDAMNAQMEYDKMAGIMRSGTRLESSYPILDDNLNFNLDNWYLFVKELESINWNAKQPEKRMNNVIAAAGKYGASEEYLRLALETANKALGVYYTEDEIQKIINELTLINGNIEKNEKANKEKSESEVYLSDISSFLEELQQIKVGDTSVNFNGNDWYEAFYKNFDLFFKGGKVNETFENDLKNKDLFLWFKRSIEDAVSDIENSTIPKLDELFGEMTNTELLEEQKDALKTLYKIAYQTGYFTDKELEEIYKKWEELGEAIEANNQQQAWEDLGSQATGAFGEFGTLMSSFGSGGMPDLLSTLIQIVSQTEAFTRLSTILTDSILPTLNAFLEPLLPIIDMLSEAIKSLVEIVLAPLFPILQGIASIIALVIGYVMTGLDLIANGVKKTIGYIVSGVENAVNWIIDMFNKIPGVNIGKVSFGPSGWADIDLQGVLEEDMAWIGDTLEKIAESNMEISDNTDPAKDFSTYQKLLAAKEIDEATYNRWTGMDKYTTQSLANGVSYAQGNRSYINVNNLTVQAPEGMTLVDFLKGIEDYNSGHSPYAVNTMAV